MYAPPSSFRLCEILAAVYLHCHVKDERSRLPRVKYCLLSSFVPPPLPLLLRPLAGCPPAWLQNLAFVFIIPFPSSIKIPLAIKKKKHLCSVRQRSWSYLHASARFVVMKTLQHHVEPGWEPAHFGSCPLVGSPEHSKPRRMCVCVFVRTFLPLSCYGDPGLQGRCQSLQLYSTVFKWRATCSHCLIWRKSRLFSAIQKLTSPYVCIDFL